MPGYPTTGKQPEVTVNNPENLPDGMISGTVNVPVTVTYPDGTKDYIDVPVTTGEKPVADNVTNEPTVKPIEKPYGETTTADDVIGAVETPGTVTVDNPGNLPKVMYQAQ